jgi:hypothetical protein
MYLLKLILQKKSVKPGYIEYNFVIHATTPANIREMHALQKQNGWYNKNNNYVILHKNEKKSVNANHLSNLV